MTAIAALEGIPFDEKSFVSAAQRAVPVPVESVVSTKSANHGLAADPEPLRTGMECFFQSDLDGTLNRTDSLAHKSLLRIDGNLIKGCLQPVLDRRLEGEPLKHGCIKEQAGATDLATANSSDGDLELFRRESQIILVGQEFLFARDPESVLFHFCD